jgi:4,5-dihydroxyphthalate decarboxylase
MSGLPLTYAGVMYDRTAPLATGAVKPRGIDLNYLEFDYPPNIFNKMEHELGFDTSEFGISTHIQKWAEKDYPFVFLPIFPSKVFRRSYMFVNRKSGIKSPKDLEGKRVGVPAWGQTAAIWQRGILANDHGVDMDKIHWVQGGVYEYGGPRGTTVRGLLKEQKVEPTPQGKTLSGMIATGEIDALIGANIPDTFGKNPDVVRLFPDARAVDREHFKKSGVFPIMHAVAIRRDVWERNKWIAESLYEAFDAAKTYALTKMKYPGSIRYMTPWIDDELDEIETLFGGDPWPSGVEPNRKTLDKLAEYMVQQHMIAKAPNMDDLFLKVGGH